MYCRHVIKENSHHLGAGGHGLRRLPRDSLGQVPDDTLELHDEHRRLRVVRVVVHLTANLILVLTFQIVFVRGYVLSSKCRYLTTSEKWKI